MGLILGLAWAGLPPVARDVLTFGLKEAWACLYGGLMLALLVATYLFFPADAPLARYDFLFLGALGIQAALLVFKLETLDEAKVIFCFHAVGTAMELFKTAAGSWVYPEAAIFRLGSVPLFSGFMYAAVGSYIARAWRLFDLRFHRYPPRWATVTLAVAIYVNFFTHHYTVDLRLGLFAASAAAFGRTTVFFTAHRTHRLPLILGLVLVALFIWFAENIGTFTGAWLYPNQHGTWRPVGVAKLGSWYLLMIISFVLVSLVHRPGQVTAAGPGCCRPGS
ncbi:DUF817 domain-containing protein [Oleomonas cavernae]|uniref:DUF817 domain-containing protein n=1 Tax=Oleomonas cavernae TaxID=2320859 RepID=A0A418WJH6_9PROT|nr:DUF817 domain-containing protein [Oleomonas cavernae]RJF89979.1 DUF817 domain-containing protein [Oleomonas cavernae]